MAFADGVWGMNIKTDDPKLAARYYQLHAELYKAVLQETADSLGTYLALYDKQDSARMVMMMERICWDLNLVLADKSIPEQVCREFNSECSVRKKNTTAGVLDWRFVMEKSETEIEAGPEFDLWIAENVMHYPIIDITPPCPHDTMPYVPHIAKFSDTPLNFHFHQPLYNEAKNYNWGMFQPSTNLLDAWQVIEKWRERSSSGYGELMLRCEGDLWVCNFGVFGKGTALLVPLAICRAAWIAGFYEKW